MQRGEVRNPITVLILSMLTCGVYAIYWLYMVVQDINRGLGREEFNFIKELALTFLTCGIWGIYFQWRLSEATVEVERAWGVQPTMDPPILFLMGVVGMGPFFMQTALNNAWENGTAGGSGYGSGQL